MRLLNQLDGSVLWLLESSSSSLENLRREARDRGVAPDRLIFAPRRGLEDHLARQCVADLFLDTLPYNGLTTASEALWVGLPVSTYLGPTFAGRVAASLLTAVGLSEQTAHSLRDYEDRALAIARDSTLLASIKSKLARNRKACPIVPALGVSRAILKRSTSPCGSAIWREHCRLRYRSRIRNRPTGARRCSVVLHIMRSRMVTGLISLCKPKTSGSFPVRLPVLDPDACAASFHSFPALSASFALSDCQSARTARTPVVLGSAPDVVVNTAVSAPLFRLR